MGPTKCQKESKVAAARPGAFVPDCKPEGGYQRKQCQASTGECWCVNKMGEEEAGTRVKGNAFCEPPGIVVSVYWF